MGYAITIDEKRKPKSPQEYRENNSGRFRKLGNGKFGGFKKGIVNGPEPTTARAGRRKNKAD